MKSTLRSIQKNPLFISSAVYIGMFSLPVSVIYMMTNRSFIHSHSAEEASPYPIVLIMSAMWG
ncbi:MAG: hypothetical protein BHV63_07480 [Alistipes sp. 56_11]|nr:MAG: hypothetical protein BHV63_07480 [Alistipes sp. 56_11]